jgi:thioredoxin reductase (NADPH)
LDIVGRSHVCYSPEIPLATNAKHVIVVGSGEAAMDYALSIARSGATVEILSRRPHLEAAGRLVDLVRANPQIGICRQTAIQAVHRDEEGCRVSILTQNRPEVVTADRVVAAIGRVSRAQEIFNGLDEDPHETVSTRLPGLYIIGDARLGALGQAGMAVGDGLGAAMAAVSRLRKDQQG